MLTWVYSRGHWRALPNYDAYETDKTRAIHEWLRKDALARRWQKFPALGPVPDKWVNTTPQPGIGGLIQAFYLAPVAAMINNENPLMKVFRS